jgi:IS5 family transposase
VAKRPDAKPDVTWHVAMRPGRRKALDLSSPLAAMIDKSQQILAGIRAKVEHPFRVIKRQFRFTKVRYRGLKKNAAQVQTLFALSNLWMARRKLMASAG